MSHICPTCGQPVGCLQQLVHDLNTPLGEIVNPPADDPEPIGLALELMKHTCHWPGCPREVPPAMWGCREHWFALPKRLRDRISATYRAGQEITKTPSELYIEAAQAVQHWIREQYPETTKRAARD